jgi:hypothetical protein
MAHYTTALTPPVALPSLLARDEEWSHVLNLLPANLEESARQAHALQRRRETRRAADLLRLVLLYAVGDLSLRLTGLWAVLLGLGCSSHVAIRQRLRHARSWLGQLLATALLGLHGLPPIRIKLSLLTPGAGRYAGPPYFC